MPRLDVLDTDRLHLRPPRAEEATVYRLLWFERDPRVPARRRIGPDGRPTAEEIAARLRTPDAPEGQLGLLAVELRREPSHVIGLCGLLLDEDAPPDEPTLAYELLQSAHGHGYATEAARAVVSWAREAGYRRLRADVWDWNIASRRVLAKLGFTEVGPTGDASTYGQNLLTTLDLLMSDNRSTGGSGRNFLRT